MSELTNIHTCRSTIRYHLLLTASTLALGAYVSSGGVAKAEDGSQPTVWIELGGQLEMMQGESTAFTAPFMSRDPMPPPYAGDIFDQNQKAARFALGLEGRLSFQPQGSDWIFSGAVRYGRSHANRHAHNQSPPIYVTNIGPGGIHGPRRPLYAAAFADTQSQSSESHTVLDFTAGKDVGLGAFGHSGLSTINAGIRYAQFSESTSVNIQARPTITILNRLPAPKYLPTSRFADYFLSGKAERTFHAVGPTLSWNASSVLLGNPDDGELELNWGVNGAVLFGRQTARTYHRTSAYHRTAVFGYPQLYAPRSASSTRSRSVVVPNVGAFAGLSVQKANAKISLGYRADFFFGATDTGIDARSTSDLGFNGPFATISIGLGG